MTLSHGTLLGMDILHDSALALWFMVPAAIANASPIFISHFPLLRHWNARLDFGAEYRGKPIFGTHKTWRGLIGGMIIATLVLWLQQLAYGHFPSVHTITSGLHYDQLPTLLLGPLFGFGALGGDAIESFFKRRRGVESGKSWFPFDQLDYIIGAVLVSLPFVILSLRQYVLILVIWFLIHIASTYIGWKLGLKESAI